MTFRGYFDPPDEKLNSITQDLTQHITTHSPRNLPPYLPSSTSTSHRSYSNPPKPTVLPQKLTFLPDWSPYISPKDHNLPQHPPSTAHPTQHSTCLKESSNPAVSLFGSKYSVLPPKRLVSAQSNVLDTIKSTLTPSYISHNNATNEIQDKMRLLQANGAVMSVDGIGSFIEDDESDNGIEFGGGKEGNKKTGENLRGNLRGNIDRFNFSELFGIMDSTRVHFDQNFESNNFPNFEPNNNNNNNQNTSNNTPHSTRYHISSLNNPHITNLSFQTLKHPSHGFFYSDDTLIHSYLPSPPIPPSSHFISPSNSIPTPHSPHETPPKLRPGAYSTNLAPNTTLSKQNRPDDLTNAFPNVCMENFTTGRLYGENLWVTPVNFVTTDAYRRLSLVTAHNNYFWIQGLLGALHTLYVPEGMVNILGYFFSMENLEFWEIEIGDEGKKIEQKLLDFLYNYRISFYKKNNNEINPHPNSELQYNVSTNLSQIESFYFHNDGKNGKNLQNLEKTFALSKLPMTLFQSLLSSIQTSFSSPILFHRKPPQPFNQANHINNQTSQTNPNTPPLTQPPPPPNFSTRIRETQHVSKALGAYDSVGTEFTERQNFLFPFGAYTHPQNPNPRPIDEILERKLHEDQISTDMLNKLIKYNLELQNYKNQPRINIFDSNHVGRFLLNFKSKTIPTLSVLNNNPKNGNRKLTNSFDRIKHRITCASLFESIIPCIHTPLNVINRLNDVVGQSQKVFYTKNGSQIKPENPNLHPRRKLDKVEYELNYLVYIESLYKRYGYIMTKESHGDILLQLDSPQYRLGYTAFIQDTRQFGEVSFEISHLAKYFSLVSQTPLFYKITPLSMAALIHSEVIFDCLYDSYGFLLALIRWAVYWNVKKYVSHVKNCQFFLNFRLNYLETIKFSLLKYEKRQNDYLNDLNQFIQYHLNNSKTAIIHPPNSTTPTTPPSPPLYPTPPQFSLELPPFLAEKYQNVYDFINSSNPCDFCYKYKDVKAVYKPWSEPQTVQSNQHVHQNDAGLNNSNFRGFRNHDDTNNLNENNNFTTSPSSIKSSNNFTLPTTIFDFNLLNLPQYNGFAPFHNTPTPSFDSKSANFNTPFDLASGKGTEQMGQFLSIGGGLFKELQIPLTTWDKILNPPAPFEISPQNTSFTAMYSAIDGDFEVCDPFEADAGSIWERNDERAPRKKYHEPNPLNEYKYLTKSPQSTQNPIKHPFGLHIPPHLIRAELAHFLPYFGVCIFNQAQLASLFKQPSIFTPFEQYHILSAREAYMDVLRGEERIGEPGETFGLSNERYRNKTQPEVSPFDFVGASKLAPSDSEPSNSPQVDQKFYTQFNSPNLRYVCALMDEKHTMIAHEGAQRVKDFQGYFAESMNGEFNEGNIKHFFEIVNEVLYEHYDDKQQKVGNYDSSAHIYDENIDSGHIANIEGSNPNLAKCSKKNHSHSHLIDPDHFLKSLIDNYHHTLHDQLIKTPGYRDGLYHRQVFFNQEQILRNPFSPIPFGVNYAKAVNKDQFYTKKGMQAAGLSRAINFQFVFPGFTSLGDRLLCNPINDINGRKVTRSIYFQGEYLLSTQKFSKISILNDFMIFKYLEGNFGQKIVHKQNSGLEFGDDNGYYNQINDNYHSNQGINPLPPAPLSHSHTNTSPETLETLETPLIQPHLSDHTNLNPPPSLSPYTPHANYPTPYIPQHPSYHSQTFSPELDPKTPIDLPLITGHGTLNHLRSLHKWRSQPNPYRKPPSVLTHHTWCGNIIVFWNWILGPVLGVLAGLALFIILGLINTDKIEANKYTLIPFPIISAMIILYPFLFALQQSCIWSVNERHICGFRRCCCVDAWLCHPTPRGIKKRWIEKFLLSATIDNDFGGYQTWPSLQRFCSSFSIGWLLIGIYLKWAKLLDLTLVQLFVPVYVGLTVGCAFSWWRTNSNVAKMETTLTIPTIISLGVLHGALTDPGNNHYNIFAIMSPFLALIFAIIVLMVVLYFIDDDLCNCNLSDCFTLFLVIFFFLLLPCIFALYFVFLSLLAQSLIRPDMGWWKPPYWAANFLTYPFFLFLLFLIFRTDGDRQVPNNQDSQPTQILQTLDDTEVIGHRFGTLQYMEWDSHARM